MANSKRQACTLKYLVQDVEAKRADRLALSEEIRACLEHTEAITALPVVDGLQVEIEVADIAPFSVESFEPYVCEHVLVPAVQARCQQTTGAAGYRLLKKHFA